MVFVDDHPRNCEDVAKNYPDAEVYLMSRPHNEKLESPWKRLADMQQFFDVIKN